MGRMGKFTASDLTRLQNQLNKIQAENAEAFVESCAKELAARLLAKVVKRTPVGDYSGNSYTCESKQQHKGHKENGKKGGTLRRGWTIEEIKKEGSVYKVDAINNTEYVSYVDIEQPIIRGGFKGILCLLYQNRRFKKLHQEYWKMKLRSIWWSA